MSAPTSTLLRILHTLLSFAIVLVALAGAAYFVLAPLVGDFDEISAPAGIGRNPALPVVDRDETMAYLQTDRSDRGRPALVKGAVDLRYETDQTGLAIAHYLVQWVFVLGFLAAVVLLRRIVRSVQEGRAFAVVNARRLRHIGWIFVGLSLFDSLSRYGLGLWALRELDPAGLPLTALLAVDLGTLVAGLFVLVLAGVFHHGAALEEDRALTI